MKATKVKSYLQEAETPLALTPAEYGGLQAAYDFFNVELFSGELPDVFITYQRKAHSAGHFAADRYSLRSGEARHHELSLNPDGFLGHEDREICDTLVHEMCHVWQQHCGKPPSRGYHNKEWAAKMKSVGLQPSNTGMVGGKETGAHMSDYPIPGGPFEKTFAKLAASGWKLNLQSAFRSGKKTTTPNSKSKFTCPWCQQNAWGKPDLHIICGPCTIEVFDKIIAKLTDRKQIASAEKSRDQITGHARMRAEAIEAKTLDRTINQHEAEVMQ